MASPLDGDLGLEVKVPPALMTVNPIAAAVLSPDIFTAAACRAMLCR
jgi:hypothetical protein